MKLISRNVRGCSDPKKWKTLNRKLMQEKTDILFLQEMTCSFEGLEKIRNKIWKGCQLMALDAMGQEGGIAILWQPEVVEISDWHANKFSLMAEFHLLDSDVRGSMGNVYGPSSFLEKHAFIDFLVWVNDQAEVGSWVIGGDFNLIASIGEKKRGRHTLDKYQETFWDFLAQSPLVDLETGNGWFT